MGEELLRKCVHYEQADDRLVCHLCVHECKIAEGKTGVCRVRKNVGGTLRSLNYARITSAGMDPIEKKPLYHFHPGSQILSLGTFGCNLSCAFCQNWGISQGNPPTEPLTPEEAVALAKERVAQGNIGIAYTYNEPIIWYEYVYDTAKLVKEAGLCNVLVTNGIIQEAPLLEILPLVDAMNVDVKSMNDEFYRKLCGAPSGELARRTVETAFGRVSVEITNLVVTGENDTEEDFRALTDWAASVSPDLPLHISRYHPAYKLSAPPTPLETLEKAAAIAREKLHYVYVGNAYVPGGGDTVCPGCGEVVVSRQGYSTSSRLTEDGRCPSCGGDVNMVV